MIVLHPVYQEKRQETNKVKTVKGHWCIVIVVHLVPFYLFPMRRQERIAVYQWKWHMLNAKQEVRYA